ncbi:DUF2029 domain-containing protein [Defluviimonas sp. WL0002]|uniref:DUF2029 domain-containing protein n=1 Tax=Albidovulum marisflavi TaxID=2984159 RepID=A0ABT2ZEN8_9RHOB|nr:glycosyltransferase family 87 protein [Defluviimonas sp. WL0002]MCV2869560.1 DUF2029 domain-containing protein [Defluviimonas sp. WL0002]
MIPTQPHQTEGRRANDLRLCYLLLALWFALALIQHWNNPSSDLAPLYMAGHFLAEGRPDLVYAAPPAFFGGTPSAWEPTLAAMGNPWPHAFPYIYPPIWAKLMSFVTPHIGPVTFTKAVMALHAALMAAGVAVAARIARPAGMRPLIWVLISIALLETSVFSETALHFNQPQITVMFLTLLAFERLQAGRERTAGLLLGVAAAIKILPGVFLLLLLFERRWRAAATFALTVASLVALSFLLAGPALHADFLKAFDRIEGTLPAVPSNASVHVSILLLLEHAGLVTLPLTDAGAFLSREDFPALPLVTWGARLAFLAALALFARRLWPLEPRLRLARGLLVLSILIALFSPVGWLHYYVISLLLLPQLAVLAPPRIAALSLVVFGAISSSTLYIQSVLSFGLDWTFMNISVAALWFAVLLLVWRFSGKEQAARSA